MSNTRRGMTTGVLAAVVLVVGSWSLAAVAQEEYPPAEDLGVACAPSQPAAGDDVACEVVGAQPGESLDVSAEMTVSLLATTVSADAAGRASFGFAVPGDAADGSLIDVVVSGAESGQASTQLTVQSDAEVLGDVVTPDDVGEPGASEGASDTEDAAVSAAGTTEADTEVLALTGNQIVVLLAVGLLLLVAGSGVLVARRRRSTEVAP